MNESTTNHDVQPIRIPVRYTFTDHEMIELAKKGVQFGRAYESLEKEFSSIKADFKLRLTNLENERERLDEKIGDGFEMRDTACYVRFNDPIKGQKSFYLEATNELVRSEAMSHFDLDRELPLKTPAETLKDAKVLPDNTDDILPDGIYTDSTGVSLSTRVGHILDSTAAKTEQPLVILPGFESDDWKATALRAAAKKAMKGAGWDVVAIATFMEQLKGDDVAAIKATLKPHVKTASEPELSHDELVSAFGAFDGKQFASVFGLLDPINVTFAVNDNVEPDVNASNAASALSSAATQAEWPDQARRQLDHAMDGATLDQLVALAERLSGKGAE